MAQIKWQKRAENELFRYLVKGFIEFGETTANNFAATDEAEEEIERGEGKSFDEMMVGFRKELLWLS